MNIGFVGLGKLGLPAALAIESKGHSVIGYDVNDRVKDYLAMRYIPYREENADKYLAKHNIKFASTPGEVVAKSDIVFIPVQTPHDCRYEGITRIPETRADFSYEYLLAAVDSVAVACKEQKKETIVVIISTVLPGTIEEQVRPYLNEYVKLCYNPFFIAMGTTINDFLFPEFILLGVDDEAAALKVHEFYCTITDAPVHTVSLAEAELTKVAYNTFIGMKISFVNTLQEICHKKKMNVDAVTDGLKLATRRLISPAYMSAGMGDGGGCHPRDNIAMSWLAKKLNLSYNIFDAIMMQRERHTEWLADMVAGFQQATNLPVMILGKSFKAETNLVVGSPSILLKNLLEEKGVEVGMWDPHIDSKPDQDFLHNPHVIFIGTKHEYFKTLQFPGGTVILDPWRYIEKPEGGSEVVVIPIGNNGR